MKLTDSKIYKAIKKSQFFYFAKVALLDADYKKNKRLMYNSHKSRSDIHREMKLVESYWRCKPLHYIRYGLYGLTLSDEELLDYIPPYYHYNYYVPSLFRNVDESAYVDKLSLYEIFVQRGVATPTVDFILNDRRLYDLNRDAVTLNDLIHKMRQETNKYFVKPIDGRGGSGIAVLELKAGQLMLNKKMINTDHFFEMFDKKRTYIIQRAIIQHPGLNAINASSVNTCRIVTQRRGPHASIKVAVLRIGRDGRLVDNSSQGGISVPIQIQNGKLCKYAVSEKGGEEFDVHPDTGICFENYQLPEWERVTSAVLRYADSFPELAEIGWDIAITEDEIVAIELNLGYGLTHLQCCCGGLRRILGIFPSA